MKFVYALVLLLVPALALGARSAAVDDLCQAHFGHPGNLGVTKAAERYFTANATYGEIAATIGVLGDVVPSNDANLQIYQWQDGQLEMHFRDSRLNMYRVGGRWNVVSNPTLVVSKEQSLAPQSNTDHTNLRQTFEEFYARMAKVIEAGRQVAVGQKERTDIRALGYYLAKLRRAIDEGNWREAKEIQDKMKFSPTSQRSHVVAADAKRRLAERQRADEERRHKEEVKQRERIHQAEMRRQQEILDEMRQRRAPR